MRFMIFMIGAFALYAQMPPVIDSKNIYSETTPGKFKPGVQRYPSQPTIFFVAGS